MSNSPPVNRPLPVTISCVLLYAAGLFVIIYTFTGVFAKHGLFYSGANVLFIIIMFAALSGIWSLEKWGVWIFLTILILKLGMDLWVRAFRWWELLLIIPLVLFLGYIGKMK